MTLEDTDIVSLMGQLDFFLEMIEDELDKENPDLVLIRAIVTKIKNPVLLKDNES